MKIIVVIDYWFPSIGGGPVHVAEIVERLRKVDKVNITVVTSNLFIGRIKKEIKLYPELNVVRLGAKAPFFSVLGRLQFLLHLFFYLLKSDYDILHVHPYSPIPMSLLIAWFKKKPIIMTVHALGNHTEGLSGIPGMTRFLQHIDRIFTYKINYAAQIFVDETLMKIGITTKKQYYIPNGVSVRNFDQINIKKPKRFQILFIGRYHSQKNVTALVKAFIRFSNAFPKTNLTLVGEGTKKDRLVEIIKESKLSNISLHSPVFGKDLIRCYKSSHLYILPSLYEGFPLTILEAWAAKIPVAATAVGAIPKLIQEGYNGFIIDNPTSEAIEHVLRKAASKKDLATMGERGYEMVKQKYSWDSTAQKTYKVYQDIMNATR